MILISDTIKYNGIEQHVQDINHLDKSIKIGVVDTNGIIWKSEWIHIDDLKL